MGGSLCGGIREAWNVSERPLMWRPSLAGVDARAVWGCSAERWGDSRIHYAAEGEQLRSRSGFIDALDAHIDALESA